jgi:peptide chain release factor 2
VIHFDIARLSNEKEELEAEMNAPDLWSNVERANALNAKLKSLTGKIDGYNRLVSQVEDAHTLIELCDDENDPSLIPEIEAEIDDIDKKTNALRLETLLKGEYDSYGAVLSLHAGAGGTEAQDWTQMLFRMYTRYCERHGFSYVVHDMLDGDEAGLKSVTFEVTGENAYAISKRSAASSPGAHLAF